LNEQVQAKCKRNRWKEIINRAEINKMVTEKYKKSMKQDRELVAHVYNPSYLGGRD
jgi:hypothetical protein